MVLVWYEQLIGIYFRYYTGIRLKILSKTTRNISHKSR